MEQHALSILGNTTANTNNPCVAGLLWDWMMNYLAEKSLLFQSFMRKKFKNHPITEKIYEDTMQEYIFQGHTSKLSKTEAKRATHYLSNYRDKNINQPDKIRISFTAGIKISYKSLNKHLFKKPHLIKGPYQFKVSPKKISSHG